MTMTKSKTWLALLLSTLAVTAAALTAWQASADGGTEKPSFVRLVKAGDTPEPQKPVSPALGRLDRYGDPLPPGAVARLGTVRFRTPDEAEALALAPDGKTIAVSSRGGLFLFDADGGKRIKRLADYMFAGRQQNTLAFSPDGKRLAAWGGWCSWTMARGTGGPKASSACGSGPASESHASMTLNA
jgi:hypothetical protein